MSSSTHGRWLTWQRAAAESRKYYAMAKVVVRMQRQGLAAALGRWASVWLEAAAEREGEQRRQYLKANIIKRCKETDALHSCADLRCTPPCICASRDMLFCLELRPTAGRARVLRFARG